MRGNALTSYDTRASATRAPATRAPATRAPATRAPATRAPATRAVHQCCWSIMPVTACSYRLQQSVPNIPVSFCYIRLIQP